MGLEYSYFEKNVLVLDPEKILVKKSVQWALFFFFLMFNKYIQAEYILTSIFRSIFDRFFFFSLRHSILLCNELWVRTSTLSWVEFTHVVIVPVTSATLMIYSRFKLLFSFPLEFMFSSLKIKYSLVKWHMVYPMVIPPQRSLINMFLRRVSEVYFDN